MSAAGLAAIGRQKAVDDLMMGKKTTDKLDPKAMYAPPPAPKPASSSAVERTRSAPGPPANGSRPSLDRRMLSSQPDLPSSSSSNPPPPPAAAVLTRPSSPPHPLAKRPQPVASSSRPRASFATAGTAPPGPPKPRASTNTLDALAATIRPTVWPAGSYDVVLLLDNRELAAKINRQGIAERCEKVLGATGMSQRALAVGDALWIAREKATGKEVALDEVLERKRLDDLCSSIKDQRFHEQKVRPVVLLPRRSS